MKADFFWADSLFNHAVAAGLPTGFTSRWASAGITWSVQAETAAGTPSGKEIKATITAGAQFAASLDAAGQRANVDVVALVLASAVAAGGISAGGVACRIGGTAGAETGYVLTLRTVAGAGDNIRLFKFSPAGTPVALVSVASAWVANTWYWLRLRAIGTSIKGKKWTLGAAEPSTWNIDTTDSDHTTGYAGIYANNSDSDPAFGYVAVAPGNSAPLFW